MEDGVFRHSEAGTPQGGVISPLLANIFLHEVLDVWFDRQVKPRLRGRAKLVRYADDAVMLFEHEDDARRVMDVLPKRFERYGLTLHPDKTRLVPFKRPDRMRPQRDDEGKGGPPSGPCSFDFLGFTIHWGKSLAGKWVVRERTAKDEDCSALPNGAGFTGTTHSGCNRTPWRQSCAATTATSVVLATVAASGTFCTLPCVRGGAACAAARSAASPGRR
jgi:hypothetical protein